MTPEARPSPPRGSLAVQPAATARPAFLDRARACLPAGAIGDALGAPIEFLSLAEIRARFGPAGLDRYAPAYGRLGAITDDTR